MMQGRPEKKQRTSGWRGGGVVTTEKSQQASRAKYKPQVMHIGYMDWVGDDRKEIETLNNTTSFLELLLAESLTNKGIQVPGTAPRRMQWDIDDVREHYPIRMLPLEKMGVPPLQGSFVDSDYVYKVDTAVLREFDLKWIQRKEERKIKTQEEGEEEEEVSQIFELRKPLIDLWVCDRESRLSERGGAYRPSLRQKLEDAIRSKVEQVQLPWGDKYAIMASLLQGSPLQKAGRVYEKQFVNRGTVFFEEEDIKTFMRPGMLGFKSFYCTWRPANDPRRSVVSYERTEIVWDPIDYHGRNLKDEFEKVRAHFKAANDELASALYDYHPELQAERHATLYGKRKAIDPGHGDDITKPGYPKALIMNIKSFTAGKTEVKEEETEGQKKKPYEPVMNIGIVTFSDQVRDDLRRDLIEPVLAAALTRLIERNKGDANLPPHLVTRFYNLPELGLESPEFRYSKYSWTAKELQDFNTIWIQKTRKHPKAGPNLGDHPLEIHAWFYGTSIGGPGNSISELKGQEIHKVLAGMNPKEVVTSPVFTGRDGNPFFAPALIASMLLDSQAKVFRLESALARKLINQPDRLDASTRLDIARELAEQKLDANSTIFIGQTSLNDTKFSLGSDSKYNLIEKTNRHQLALRLNNMTTTDKKQNALLALQLHHAKVGDALLSLHPRVLAYEAVAYLRDVGLMDRDSGSVLTQFMGKASDYARKKAGDLGEVVTDTATLPIQALEQPPLQFVKTTAAFPLDTARTIVSGHASFAATGHEDKEHTCGWDTKDENVRQHLGPGYWDVLHRMTANVHRKERDLIVARAFILWVAENFPCESCRVKFVKSVSEPPIEQVPKDKLFEHIVDLHNQVNRERGAEDYPLSKAKRRYKYNEE